MERLKSEDILKPGAVMNTEQIDLDDPKNAHIKEGFEYTKLQQELIEKLMEIDPEQLEQRVTI
jgi:hypothetical protein